jgi:hypothetical protein
VVEAAANCSVGGFASQPAGYATHIYHLALSYMEGGAFAHRRLLNAQVRPTFDMLSASKRTISIVSHFDGFLVDHTFFDASHFQMRRPRVRRQLYLNFYPNARLQQMGRGGRTCAAKVCI